MHFDGDCFAGENTGPIPGLCGVGGCDLDDPAVGISSRGRVARIWGVIGGVGIGDWPAEDARLATDGTDGIVFHGDPGAGRAVSAGRATGLRCGVRQFGTSDTAGGRGVVVRDVADLVVSASAMMAFISTLDQQALL